MKKEDIKRTLTYQKLRKNVYIFSAFFSFIVLLFIAVILNANGDGKRVVLAGFLLLVVGGYALYHILDLRMILLHAESFEKCDGRIVSITSGSGRGYAKMIVEFKDFMKEDYRMESHNVFTINEIGDQMGHEVVIYFSKAYPIVLIDQFNTEKTATDDALDEEEHIW
jgi:hypothetical protein